MIDAELFYVYDNQTQVIIKNSLEFDSNAANLMSNIAAYNNNGQYILISTDKYVDDLISDYGGIRCEMKDAYRHKICKTPPSDFLFGDGNIYSSVPVLESSLSDIKTVKRKRRIKI